MPEVTNTSMTAGSSSAEIDSALRSALDALLAFRHGDTKHLTQEHARILFDAIQPAAPTACPTSDPSWPESQPCSVCGAFGPWFDTSQNGECVEATGGDAMADEVQAATPPRYIVDGLPELPDDDADFTPYLARKIISKYQELLRDVAQCAWKPIETAPRDGTRILATGGGLDNEIEIVDYNVKVGAWNSTNYTLDDRDDEAEGYNRPTLWRPLPIGPSLPSTNRHSACQVCGETADLTSCGPSRFGDETWACKDCWEPDGSISRPQRETP